MIIQAILDVANDPRSHSGRQPNGKIRVEGECNGVIIRVVVDPPDRVVTAHPISHYSV